MFRKLLTSTLLIAFLPASLLSAEILTAEDILKRADQHLRGKTSISEMTMSIVKPKWSREITMKAWSKEDRLALILITSPARDKGTTFLLRDREVWNWLPSIERIVKIPPSMMAQSWMGSDFTNDDLVRESSFVKDYNSTIKGDSTIDNRSSYIIELTPKPEAPVVWGKVRVWISKQDYLQLRAEFYDEDGILINIMQSSEIKTMGGRLLPTRLEMLPVDKPDSKTIMQYNSLIYDQPIDDKFFSEQNMKNVR